MEKEYLSIKDFAQAVGISQQAVYKQLNNKLQPYLKVVDNKKMLEKSALKLFEKEEKNSNVEQQLINMLNENLEVLKKQLEEKDKTIASLNENLKREQELHGIEKARTKELQDKLLLLEQKDKDSEPVKEVDFVEVEQTAEAKQEVHAEVEVKPTKKWWQIWK